MVIFFCNIGWMKKYNGIDGDSISRGGKYNKENVGHEVCNFTNVNGKVYGYVETGKNQIKIEKLGASKQDEFINNVTVVWTASLDNGGTAVIGWYKNATVYRWPQSIDYPTKIQQTNNLDSYRIEADFSDVTLLSLKYRNCLIFRAVKGGMGQSNVWYADKPESSETLKRVKRFIEYGGYRYDIPDIDNSGELEGNLSLVTHLRRDRNPSIIKRKKETTLQEKGALECEVCGFDFAKFYGKDGENFCEVHHLVPLHKADGTVETKLDDLAIVCSNCHRIIHRINPMPSIEELSKKISAKK